MYICMCAHVYTATYEESTHNLWCFFSPKQVNCLFSTNNNRHTLFLVCVVALLCSALRVGGHAKNVELSLTVSPSLSLSRAEMLRGEWVSCGGVSLTESGKEVNFVDKKGKRFSLYKCAAIAMSLSLVLSLFLLFVCAQLFSIVAISCFDSQTVKNLTTAATTTSNDNKTTVEKPHKC